jgi:hypothetical protein
MAEQRYIQCPLCRNRIPVPSYGRRPYLNCSCGVRLEVASDPTGGADRYRRFFATLAVAGFILAVVDLARRFL